MKPSSLRFSLVLALFLALTVSAQTTDNYQPGPDSIPQPGVPKGEILKFTFASSKIFPGTTRDYWVYVPAQYKPDKPACVFVCQDGIRYEAPTVFDNLINRKEMPVTIGVFVAPGVVKATDANAALDRFNRSFEYDGLGDDYARFLLEELLPEVETKKTSDGRALKLSHDGNDRAIGGESSGAIAAFTVAWERPDALGWLWKDWPKPVTAGPSQNATLASILLPGEQWQLVGEGYKSTEGPAVNSKGEVFFNDIGSSKIYKVGLDDQVSQFIANSRRGSGQAFGPDGRLYAVAGGDQKVIAYATDGT